MRAWLTTTALCACLLAQAQAQPQPSSEIPVSYHDGLLWVHVCIPQSSEPLNFLFDSGAATSVLTRGTAQRLGIKLLQRVDVRGVGTETLGYWTPPINANVGGERLSQKFLAVDLEKLSECCGQRIDGLLGADFFRGRVVQIDYAAERVRLLPSFAPSTATQRLPLRVQHQALCVPVRVNGRGPQWVRLDTGCASALQWVCGNHLPPLSTSQFSVGLTGISTSVAQTTVQLGKQRCEGVPTGLHQREIFAGESGLLGNGLLSHYTITIDALRGQMFLE